MTIGTAFNALLVVCCLLSSRTESLSIMPVPRPITFGFTVDVTGSMSSEIAYVRKAIDNSTYHLEHYKKLGIDHFVLTTFSDPKNLTVTSEYFSLHALHAKVKMLKTSGGGDCPEYGLDGLTQTIQKSRYGSYIFYFSDAGVHESYMASNIAMAAKKKNIKIWIIATGCCSGPCKTYSAYVKIANMTHGVYYSITQSQIPDIMKYVNYNVRCRKIVNLLNPPKTYAGIKSWLASHPGCMVPPSPPILPPTTGATGLTAQLLTMVMALVATTMSI